MSGTYQQAFTTTDVQNNITYVHFVHPDTQNILYKEEITEDSEYYAEDATMDEETIEESYVDDDPIGQTVEILESVIVERKKIKRESDSRVTKKLVQVKGISSKFWTNFLIYLNFIPF